MFWEVVLLTPLVAVLAGLARSWMKMQERRFELLAERSGERAEQATAKTARLEQRVAVLERILTDRSARLGDEIERLRDMPVE